MSEYTLYNIMRAVVGVLIIAATVFMLSCVTCLTVGFVQGAVTGEFPEWMRSE